MQVYGRGIIRRLPTMLHGDPRRIRMVYSLMFSMPGTPVLFYGEEIGMGEDLAVGNRSAVRTPMQWTADISGGFSRAPKRKLVAKVVSDGFGPEHVNVSDQRHDPDSLLNFMRLLIRRRRTSPEMGWGALRLIPQSEHAVLVHQLSDAEGRVVVLHNFRGEPATVSFVLDDLNEGDRLVDMLVDDRVLEPDDAGRLTMPLDGYGYCWLRVLAPHSKRLG